MTKVRRDNTTGVPGLTRLNYDPSTGKHYRRRWRGTVTVTGATITRHVTVAYTNDREAAVAAIQTAQQNRPAIYALCTPEKIDTIPMARLRKALLTTAAQPGVPDSVNP